MENITINGKIVTIINQLNELNINQFNKLISIMSSDDPELIKFERVVRVLCSELTQDDIDEMDMDVLENLLDLLDLNGNDTPIRDSITIDGNVFRLKGDVSNFKFKVGQMNKIFEAIKADKDGYVSTLAAILYSNNQTSIADRVLLFNEKLTMDYIAPFIKILTDKYVK